MMQHQYPEKQWTIYSYSIIYNPSWVCLKIGRQKKNDGQNQDFPDYLVTI